jgi:dihydropteroate synthase
MLREINLEAQRGEGKGEGMPTPILVGVLNVTPDSFSDGGKYASVDAAVDAGARLVDEGAAWIDVGGESTRPGAAVVSEAEEIARVVPVIRALTARLGGRARISIDTYKAGTARAALAAGASVVNDISGGLLDPPILTAAAGSGAVVVLGHLRGQPATMMNDINFQDVVREVGDELQQRIEAARAGGCTHIWADPGIGFGKRTPENLALLAGLRGLCARWGVPVMVGVSRKRFLGELTGRPPEERAFGTAAAVAAAVLGGASALRVHDVAVMSDVVRVAAAIAAAKTGD